MSNLEHLIENGLSALKRGVSYEKWLKTMKDDVNWQGNENISIEQLWTICQYVIYTWMPSAEPEVIHCMDCKWWDKSEDSPFGYCMAMKHRYMSANWEIGIYRRYKGDFYCADAERREYE